MDEHIARIAARQHGVISRAQARAAGLTRGAITHRIATGRWYEISARVYRLAVEEAGGDPERVLMVAAHAWDLRGAGDAGMRTAYVPRPVGDPPAETDAFDGRFSTLAGLADALD